MDPSLSIRFVMSWDQLNAMMTVSAESVSKSGASSPSAMACSILALAIFGEAGE